MNDLIKLLENVQYGRKGKLNENDFYEVKIKRDHFTEEAIDFLLDNVEWFDTEECDIYITLSQKQINKMLKNLKKEGK